MLNRLRQIPILDGHNDVLKRAHLTGTSFLKENPLTGIDRPRALAGQFAGGFFAIMTPPEDLRERHPDFGLSIFDDGWEVEYPRPVSQEFADRFTRAIIEEFVTAAAGLPDVAIIRSYADLERSFRAGSIAVILHLEGAEALRGDLENLQTYIDLGVRSIGPVWSRPNVFGYGVPFKFPATPDVGPGLTPLGKRLVAKCNEHRLLIDLTHITERGFWDVAEITNAPLVISHANVNRICPSSTNLLDSQIDAVGQSGGVIGVLFDVLNTRPDGKLVHDSPVRMLIDHIDYIADRIGIDHVALGSDIDGGGEMLAALNSVERFQFLIERLLDVGYSVDDVEKIAHRNWLRAIHNTWQGTNFYSVDGEGCCRISS